MTSPVRADLPAAGDVGHDLRPGVVEEEQLVVLGDAVAVGVVEGPGEPAAPGAAVLADLAERLDDQRVLADALLDGRQLAGLDQLGELGGLLEALRHLGGIGDDLRPLELADEVRARLRRLGAGGPAGSCVAETASRPSRSRRGGTGRCRRGVARFPLDRSWVSPFALRDEGLLRSGDHDDVLEDRTRPSRSARSSRPHGLDSRWASPGGAQLSRRTSWSASGVRGRPRAARPSGRAAAGPPPGRARSAGRARW